MLIATLQDIALKKLVQNLQREQKEVQNFEVLQKVFLCFAVGCAILY